MKDSDHAITSVMKVKYWYIQIADTSSYGNFQGAQLVCNLVH